MKRMIELMKTDMAAIGAKHDLWHLLLYLLFSYNKRPVLLIRIINNSGGIQKVLRMYLRSKYMIEVSCKEIGGYLRLPHPRGIILAATSIGSNCLIGQWVTLGGNNCKIRMNEKGERIEIPTIGNNVQILAGSVVAGPIILGDEIVIGANSTVTFDVPSNTLIYNRPSVSTSRIKVPGYLGAFYRINEHHE